MIKYLLAVLLAFILPVDAQQITAPAPCAANTLTATVSSSNVQLSKCGPAVYLMNTTSQEAFWTIGGTSSVAATTAANTTSSYSLPGGAYIRVSIPNQQNNWFAAITASSTTTIRIFQASQ